VSAGVLYYYLRDIDWQALARSTARVDLPLAIAAVAVPQLLAWVCGTLIIQRTLTWFHGPFPFRAFFWLRGASYILMFVNTLLGGGGQLLYQQRRSGVSWTRLMGIVLFRVGLGLWCITVLLIPLTLALYALGLQDRVQLNLWVWWGLLAFGAVWLVEAWLFWHHGGNGMISRLVVRDRDSEFWTAFRRATSRQWLAMFALSAPPVVLTVIGYHLVNLAFGIEVPFVEAMVMMPLALVVMDLPVAFAGFGTATMAWMAFFGAYGSVEAITAMTLFLPTARMLVRAAIGLVSLRPALPEIELLLGAVRARARQSPDPS
jgi:hypothetical protein